MRGVSISKESRYEEDSKSYIMKVYVDGNRKVVSEYKIPISNCPRSESKLPANLQWEDEIPTINSFEDLWIPSRRGNRKVNFYN